MSELPSWPLSEGPVLTSIEEDGALWRLTLNTPKANIVDAAKVKLLDAIYRRAADARGVKAVLLDASGPHFSFGASVEEHLPGQHEAMLEGFHGLFRTILDASLPTLVAVRGQCLGGALELAAFGNRLFASADAKLGQPEIVLGVIAPVASVILAERVGRGHAEDLCLSGRSVGAAEAERIGLVDQLDDDPGKAALDYFREHLAAKSATSLRFAQRAVRYGFAARFRAQIDAVERLYNEELMQTPDAVEGLNAFLEKRSPSWADDGAKE